ncbi:hypothetical protein HA41_00525 [Pantoea conspicua]|uniref:Uncharacterized protein n=1 Tax=Pantoea conspicua TaxID=472705 RepID=A0A1X1C2R2_9GAMM|nr:hypothetical protein [Pantoea conspicua]ORM55951.1 hypothetical protein HA41_00525 [Pantoea conspicua]
MKKLTAERCKQRIIDLQFKRDNQGMSNQMYDYLDALEIALPILEQQERGEGEWIEWEGREIPGAVKGRVVQVRYATGEIETEYSGFLNWGNGSGKLVCAYRIIPDQPTNQNGEQ